MPKGLTDYLLFIWGHRKIDAPSSAPSDRDWNVFHLSSMKTKGIVTIKYNNHIYAFEPSKAFESVNRRPWMPTFTFNWNKFKVSFKEWMRRKKVGHLYYLEPEDPEKGILTPIQPLTFSDIVKLKKEFKGNTPQTLKAMIEDRSYRKSLSSLPFSKKRVSKIILIVGVVGIIAIMVILVASGVIRI